MAQHQDRISELKQAEGSSLVTSGVDLTLIRNYLAMTPTERLQAWYSAARLVQELQKHAPRGQDHS